MVGKHTLKTTLDVRQWKRYIGPCLSEDSRSSKRNVRFLWVLSRSLPKPLKLILLGILMHHVTDTYAPTLKRRGGSLISPDLTKNKCCLTRGTFVMSHNGRRNNHLQSTEKYHDNGNTSFGGHQL